MAAPVALLPMLFWWYRRRRKLLAALAELKRIEEERIAEERRIADEKRRKEDERAAEEARKEAERKAREQAKRLRAWARRSSRTSCREGADVIEGHETGAFKFSCTTRESYVDDLTAGLEAEMAAASKAVSRLPRLSARARDVAMRGGRVAFELDGEGNWVQVTHQPPPAPPQSPPSAPPQSPPGD